MKKIIPIIITLLMASCAPVSVVIDRYDNNREKTVAIMKVDKKDGFIDTVMVELLTYHSNGQMASSTDMMRNNQHGKHVEYSRSGEVIAKGKFENNLKSDKWSWFGRDGILDSLRTFEKGMLSGKSIDYSLSGKITREIMYLNNNYHGKSIQYNDNGKKSLIGEYLHGIPHGKWTWFNTSGKKERIVTYKKGIKDGPVSIWNDKGKKAMTGTYINDKKDGEWKWYNDDKGLDSLIQYTNNQYNGKYNIWHFNGKKAAMGTYVNGIKTGEWSWFSTKGELDSTKFYTQGILNGSVTLFYTSNKEQIVISELMNKIIPGESNIKSIMVYKAGKLHGEKIDYFSNGQKRSLWTYDMGIRSGLFTIWSPSGFRKESGTYLNNKPNGLITRWYGHGQISSIATYSKGNIHGGMRIYSPSGVVSKESYYYMGQEWCSFEYHDNGWLKEVKIYQNNKTAYQRNWNKLGLDITAEEFISGIHIEKEIYFSGNLKSETSFKGDMLHGLSRAYKEDRSMIKSVLYLNGEELFRREYPIDEEPIDTLFPDGALQTIIKIE